MCTLILATRAYSDAPLILAANRDEALDRPARGPTLRTDGPRRILAPTDLVAGGTWLGMNDRGVIAAITNRASVVVDPTRPSRGALVLAALAHERAEDAFTELAGLDAGGQNGFHLVIADRSAAFLVWGDGERLTTSSLPAGVHVVTERSFDAAPTGREPLIASLLPGEGGRAPDPSVFAEILKTRAEPSFDGVLVDWAERNYGTRSSTILYLGEDVRLEHADGPPDKVAYEDFSEAATALLQV